MKWRKPFIGQYRIITRFLLFPKRIGLETRWLEIVRIKQVYTMFGSRRYWKDKKFVKNNEKGDGFYYGNKR